MGYDNKGRFGLWQNRDRKEATHPHLAGQGEDLSSNNVWVSAWFSKDLSDNDKKTLADMLKRYQETSKKPFINVVIKPKISGADNAQAAISDNSQPDDNNWDSGIPF